MNGTQSGAARFLSTPITQPAALRLAALCFLIGAWELLARTSGHLNLIAPPSLVVETLFTRILSDAAIRAALLVTLFEIGCAYSIAVTMGLVIGLSVGWSASGRRALQPVILLLYAIPQIVLLPLFTLAFGIGPTAKIAFGASHGVFPVVVNVIAGMRDVNPLHVRAARAMGATRVDIVRNVIFPTMALSFFAGLRLAMTMTLLGVVLAELYVSTAGVGYYAKLFAENFDPSPLFALVGTLAAIAIGLNEIVRIVERRFAKWKT